MGLKGTAAKLLAHVVHRQTVRWSLHPEETQKKLFQKLVETAKNTRFGEDHNFASITRYRDFKEAVPIRDYEALLHYTSKILEGEENVLWPGKPLYLSKTSGTTSGIKYIPISRDSMPYHVQGARNALLSYVHQTGNASFLEGKMIFLSGSPRLEEKSGIPTGRLSGIVNHHIPSYLRGNQLPGYETNCVEDWEKKLDKIVDETINSRMTLISGIPPWIQMYFDRIMELTGKTIGEVFPHLKVIAHGGVNFEPYRQKLLDSIGRPVDTIETYPASEGFIAYQDDLEKEGLLLLLNSGIYYEFVRVEEINSPNPPRLAIKNIELGVNYAIIISTNAGLWGYNLGDTVKFVSKEPYRIVVTGRIKQFISAFGEHVIAEEVETTINQVAREEGVNIIEFSVAPQVNPHSGLPYHEWFIEFENLPENMEAFRMKMDEKMCLRNIYYNDLVAGRILQPLIISPVKRGGFIEYMKKIGKLGGQNKVPHLSNDRSIADKLDSYILQPEKA
ncbi:MAG: GH3 auxin-responsive promoter family protein [Bacteroidota bacterium]|nr:GH3 auxin-responsive promoter family protein [Bacteroidota bacterium]